MRPREETVLALRELKEHLELHRPPNAKTVAFNLGWDYQKTTRLIRLLYQGVANIQPPSIPAPVIVRKGNK